MVFDYGTDFVFRKALDTWTFSKKSWGKRKRKQKFGYFEAIGGFSPLEIDAHKTSKWVLSSSPKRVRAEHSKTGSKPSPIPKALCMEYSPTFGLNLM